MNIKDTLKTAGDYALNAVPVVGLFRFMSDHERNRPGIYNFLKTLGHVGYNSAWAVYLARTFDTGTLNLIEQQRVITQEVEITQRVTEAENQLSLDEKIKLFQEVGGNITFNSLTFKQKQALVEKLNNALVEKLDNTPAEK